LCCSLPPPSWPIPRRHDHEGDPPPKPAQACAAKFEKQVVGLKHLEAALALADKQKPLFEQWKAVRLDIARGLPCPTPATGLDVPTPTRLEHQIAMMSTLLERCASSSPRRSRSTTRSRPSSARSSTAATTQAAGKP